MMKGLLLKDFYMMLKYCRAYLFMAVIFSVISFVDNDLFLAFYPCMLCGMVPVQLLGYDERSKWLQYSETTPYSRKQIVSGKYLIGLLAQMAMLVVMGVTQAIKMGMNGGNVGEYFIFMGLLLALALISSSISLPFMFKYGVDKGRVAFYIAIGVVSAGSAIFSQLLTDGIAMHTSMQTLLPILCVFAVGIYALSWYVSVLFYNKREL